MLGNLVVGTGAFVIGGIVEPLARSLDVSVAAAGQLMTVYATANAVAAPLLLAAVGRWDARTVLLGSMAVLVAANVASALADGWGALAASRVLMACGAGLYAPTAAALGVALVPPGMRGRALSASFAGMGLSYVVGVPFGTWAAMSGQGWPVAFWAVAGVGLAVGAMLLAAPRGVPTAPASLSGFAAMLRDRQAMLALSVTALYFASIFSLFTYVGAFLRDYAQVPADRVAAVLVAFGTAALGGTFAGGALADRIGPTRMLYAICAGFVVVFGALWAMPGRTVPLIAVFLVWGVIGFAFYASQQLRLVTMAPQQATVMLSLNASMIYVGNATGAALGGAVLTAFGHRGLPVTAGVLILAVAAAVRATDRGARRAASVSASARPGGG